MKRITSLLIVLTSFGVSYAAPYRIGDGAVGTRPVAAAYNQVSHLWYVTNNGSNDVSILVGTGAQNTHLPLSPHWGGLIELARVPVGAGPSGIAVHGKTGLVYVSNQGEHSVSVLDGATGSLISTIQTRSKPWGLAVDSDRNRLCVANFADNNVDIFDSNTWALVTHVSVPGGPIGVAAGGGFCYVTSFYTGTVTKIDLSGPSVVASGLSVAGIIASQPQGISLTPDGAFLFVANSGVDSLSKINPANLGVIKVFALPSGSTPTGVAASASIAYVSEYGRDVLAAVSTVTGMFAELIAGSHPIGVAVGGTPECAAVADSGSDTAGISCDLSI